MSAVVNDVHSRLQPDVGGRRRCRRFAVGPNVYGRGLARALRGSRALARAGRDVPADGHLGARAVCLRPRPGPLRLLLMLDRTLRRRRP